METNIVNIVTTVDAVGVVEAKNNLAAFTLSLKAKGETIENAESQVQEKTSLFLKDLQGKKISVVGEISTSVSNYRLEHREGAEKFAAGFQSVSTITWTMAVDSNLDDVYRTCIKVDREMSMPLFSINNREELQKQAYQKAGDNVKEKLHKECALLGVSPEQLKVYNWNFGHEGVLLTNRNFTNNGVYGVTGATGPTGSQGPTGMNGYTVQMTSKLGSIYQELLNYKLIPGTTTVKVPVQVNYIWA